MLKGISPFISPALLEVLARMGHGDEIVFADAHFPGESLHNKVIRADGIQVVQLLDAILPLFELDSYSENPILMMAAVTGDTLDPQVEAEYVRTIQMHAPNISPPERISRSDFYQRAKNAFAIVMTGETRKYHSY